MREKILAVAGFAAQQPEPVFQRCERTWHARKLHDETPQEGCRMDPYSPRPPKDEYRTEQDKEYKEHMNKRDRIGKQDVPHAFHEFCALRGS